MSQALSLEERIERHAQSAHLLLSLEAADRGWSPTNWQKGLHPRAFQPKIEVIFDGVDTQAIYPDTNAYFDLPDGSRVRSGDEVITYAARSLEPGRGFPSFMRAIPALLARRPSARIVIAGDPRSHYDPPPSPEQTWLDVLQQELSMKLAALTLRC